ncbi:armadillo-type protein [Entophlyctis helioformis]|nr:armadillo-type protein [Entophlyctis helioformis]
MDIFGRVRTQTSSGLENQRQIAVLLAAVEQTIVEQGEQLVPLAYFGALMSMIEGQLQREASEDMADGSSDSVLAAASYLLAMVFPRIPQGVLRLKFEQIAQIFDALFDSHDEEAPLVRATISCAEFLLVAQDSATWTSNQMCKKLHETLLLFTIDNRPKVRKIAGEAIRRILLSAPPPSFSHPATPRTIEFCAQLVNEFVSVSAATSGSAADADRTEVEQKVLYSLVFIKSVIAVFAAQARSDKIHQRLEKLSAVLLALPVRSSRVGNTVITQWVFQVFDALLSSDESSGSHAHLEMPLLASVVKQLLQITPYQNDAALTPAWLNLIADGFVRLSDSVREHDLAVQAGSMEEEDAAVKEFCTVEFPSLVASVFDRIFSTLLSKGLAVKPAILQRATILLSVLANQAVSNTMVDAAVQDDAPLNTMIATINKALTSIHFRDTWGYVLHIAASLIERVAPAAPSFVTPIVTAMFGFRDDPAYGSSFPYKDELARAINVAIQSLGMAAFVDIVPLNIENELPTQPRRPYLLSSFNDALKVQMAPSTWTPSRLFGTHTLEFFLTTLLPLATRLLEKAGRSWTESKQVEAKLFETLGIQIFDLFPLICASLPADVGSQFAKLAPHIGRLLQTSPDQAFPNLPSKHDFRPVVCEGLKALITTLNHLANLEVDSDEDTVSTAWRTDASSKAKSALRKIAVYSNRFLSALCNNYTTIDPSVHDASKAKGQALQVLHEREMQRYESTIRAFLLIADKKAVADYFMTMIKSFLEKQTEIQAASKKSGNSNSGMQTDRDGPALEMERLRMYAILDLTLLLVPFLPADEAQLASTTSPLQFFFKMLVDQMADPDATLQKKTYKALLLLLQTLPPTAYDQAAFYNRLFDETVVSRATSGTKRSRIRVIQYLCESLVDKQILLQAIPAALPEVILATKEASEKSREAGYDCLVAMGRQMLAQGQMADSAMDMSSPSKTNARSATLANALAKSGIDSDDEGMKDEHDDDDENQDQPEHQGELTLREFFLMVVAGLASTTAHMQSASINSLARLLFEFADSLDSGMVTELLRTVMLVMQSRNKEVVKAALGFIKVAIVCLPQELLEDDLETVIVKILEHSHDHKSHFKSKVRHIFERLIRRFSLEAVEGFVPEADQKLVANIRKRRERLKKQKASQGKRGEQGDDVDANDDPAAAARRSIQQAKSKGFESVMHGSDSELGSDSDGEGGRGGRNSDDDDSYLPEQFRGETRKVRARGARIREDEDIVDFLDTDIVSKVSAAGAASGRVGRARGSAAGSAAGTDARRKDFKATPEGRLIIRDEEDGDASDSDDAGERPRQEDYYKQSLESETAFTRMADGRIKFVDKRKRDEDAMDEDDDHAQNHTAKPHQRNLGNGNGTVGSGRWGQSSGKGKTHTQQDRAEVDRMLGRQYKAKRARGDIKKAGMPAPHAYIPLSGHVVGNMHKSTKLDEGFRGVIKAAHTGSSAGSGKGRGHGGAASGDAAGNRTYSRSKANKKHK